MPDCPHCSKHYERNGAHFREHVANCKHQKKTSIMDAYDDIPTPKAPPPDVSAPKEKKPAPQEKKAPEPQPAAPQPTQIVMTESMLKKLTNPAIMDVPIPQPQPQPIPVPVEVPKAINVSNGVSDGAKICTKILYAGSSITQSAMKGMLKDFDTRIYEKRESYANLIDEILVKRNLQFNVIPEIRLGAEISEDLYLSMRDRAKNPMRFEDIPKRTRTAQPNQIVEKKDPIDDWDSVFD